MSTGKTDVFLSYAREDSAAAARLYSALCQAGLVVWFDKESLRPGERWQRAVEAAIRNSRYFVALMSSKAVAKRGFVQREIRRALEVLDEFPESETYLIPVRLEECHPSHPRLADLHWTDLFPSWDAGVEKLLRFFRRKPVSPTLAPTVRLDGLYQTKRIRFEGTEYTAYLRFYSDGMVINVSATGSAAQVARWFTRENKAVQKGYYSVSGPTLRFSATSKEGTVDYEGNMEDQKLVLRSHSHVNDHRDVEEFEFVQV
jgi:hypothetical protein